MKLFLLFYMCHFAMGLTHCYKTTVFLHLSRLTVMVTLSVDHATDFETIKIFHTTYIKLYLTMLSESPETSDQSTNQ